MVSIGALSGWWFSIKLKFTRVRTRSTRHFKTRLCRVRIYISPPANSNDRTIEKQARKQASSPHSLDTCPLHLRIPSTNSCNSVKTLRITSTHPLLVYCSTISLSARSPKTFTYREVAMPIAVQMATITCDGVKHPIDNNRNEKPCNN